MYSIDAETYYDKDVSLKVMSTWAYVFHPLTQAYLIAVHNDEFHWVGEPKDFDWSLLHGQELWAHNASFDALVWQRLVKDGVIPATVVPARWLDTADLVAYMRHPRALKDAVRELFGVDLSKSVRDRAKGKTVAQMKAEGWWNDMVKYGGADAEWCYKIAKEHGPKWPECERTMSILNREAGWAGISIDWDKVEGKDRAIAVLTDQLHEALKNIPWAASGEDKPLSPFALRAWGRDNGLAVPASLAKTDEAAQKFFDTYGGQYPTIGAVRDYRRINMLLQKVQRLVSEKREDGTIPYQCKYFGAATGRMSGGGESGGKLNIQNMPKEEMFGVGFRELIVPSAKNKVFGIFDYGQIEARLLTWRVGDTDTLAAIRAGLNLYEAFAKDLLGMADPKGLKKRDPPTYAMVKGATLGGGFQMGGARFKDAAPLLTRGEYRPSLEEANRVIALYREKKPKVVAHWEKHRLWVLNSIIGCHDTHEIQLASGRWLTYYRPHWGKDKYGKRQMMASFIKGEAPKRVFGGLLTENEIQATARDILRDAWIALVAAGYKVLFTVHDEFVIELDRESAAEAAKDIERIMCSSSPWALECPMDVDINIAEFYDK